MRSELGAEPAARRLRRFADIARAKIVAGKLGSSLSPDRIYKFVATAGRNGKTHLLVVCNSSVGYRLSNGAAAKLGQTMSREAALDLRQIIRECYDAVVAMNLQRSRSFHRPTNCAIPEFSPHAGPSAIGAGSPSRRRPSLMRVRRSQPYGPRCRWSRTPPNIHTFI
jgi:hypothetical protein